MRWLVLVMMAGCGRIGFDPVGAGGGGGTPPVGNRAFVTSSIQMPGGLGGLAGADAVCTARATEAGLAGHFVAWASTSAVNAVDRLASARGWYRTDNVPLADTADEIASGQMLVPLRTDEWGHDVGFDPTYVATGTYGGMVNANCDDFTNPAALGVAGFSFYCGGRFENDDSIPCGDHARLYCFQVDLDVPIVVPQATGRRAFVTAGTFTPSSGLASADALCASEAASAGLAGSFLALLPGTDSGSSRFDATGLPWVRLDGVALADTAMDLISGNTRAPLEIDSTGAYVDAFALVGINTSIGDLSAPPDNTLDCDGWTNPNGSTSYGVTTSTGLSSFAETTSNDCVTPQRVYCLER